jgi:transposase
MVVYMAEKRYDESFKLQMVQLYNAGKSQAELRKEFDLKPATLSGWISKYNGVEKPKKKLELTEDQKEIVKLKKQNKQLEMERDILKQAALIFGKK